MEVTVTLVAEAWECRPEQKNLRDIFSQRLIPGRYLYGSTHSNDMDIYLMKFFAGTGKYVHIPEYQGKQNLFVLLTGDSGAVMNERKLLEEVLRVRLFPSEENQAHARQLGADFLKQRIAHLFPEAKPSNREPVPCKP